MEEKIRPSARKRYIIANWKMNLDLEEARKLIYEIDGEFQDGIASNKIICIAPPYPFIHLLEQKQMIIKGAQNCFSKESGAYTGEVSALMLSSLGVEYCIVGHSERRSIFNESTEDIKQKVDLLLRYDVRPVFCCGEPEEVRKDKSHLDFISEQIKSSLFHLSEDKIIKVTIAYEPIWAIGTGNTATSPEIEEMHTSIRQNFSLKFGSEAAEKISILYGGSVKPENSEEIFNINNVDGALVGGASLKKNSLLEIIKRL